MTYKEQTIAGPKVRARLPQFAAELTKITGREWTARTREHDTEFHDLVNTDGWSLYISLPWGTRPGQIHVGTNWPKAKDGTQFTMRGDDQVDGINISISKTDEQIAKDITRRMLPLYGPAFARLMERIKKHDDYQDLALANAERVAAATAGVIRKDYHRRHEPHQRQDEYNVDLKGVYSCRVSGSGVRLEIHGMSVATAILMLQHFRPEEDGDVFVCSRCDQKLHRAESESTTHPGYCVACSDYLRED
jgi:hypothetical protein